MFPIIAQDHIPKIKLCRILKNMKQGQHTTVAMAQMEQTNPELSETVYGVAAVEIIHP